MLDNRSVTTSLDENQVIEQKRCILCEGYHGNNTLCQMGFVDQGGSYELLP